jgi:uncharacterized membrane protein (DUF4010 family)
MPANFPIFEFAVALLIGALVGIDREKRKTELEFGSAGGLRTFVLLALAGALSAWLSRELDSPWIFVATGVMITCAILAGFYLHARSNPSSYGLTTEVAAIVVFLLGGTTLFGYMELAVALAIATSAILAYKHPLHGLVERLQQDDIYAGLKLLIATFIVLPVLPDRTVDPWEAVNPYRLWWLVILIAGISLVGYIASRWLGPRRGTAVTGLAGGLVSSTAVTLTFARRSKSEPAVAGSADALASGLLLAWAIMFGRVVVEVAVVNRDLLPHVILPMLTLGAVNGLVAVVCYLLGARHAVGDIDDSVPLKNPFSLTSAIKFALFFTAVLVVVKLVEQQYSGQGLYVLAALAGLTDVDAITLSMAEYAKQGDVRTAVVSIVIAAISNTLVKCGLVLILGSRALMTRVVLATLLLLAVTAAFYFLV